MAGNYPDVPAPRMAYDRDGSATLFAALQATAAQAAELNNEATDVAILTIAAGEKLTVVFPQKRTLVGIYLRSITNSAAAVEVSTNTTTGADGTWTSVVADFDDNLGGVAYRANIRTLATPPTGINAVRFLPGAPASTWQPTTLHLYGTIDAGQSPNRLSFWHPTLDQEVDGAHFDFGDIPRGTTASKTFRVKNRSATLTASGVVVSDEVLTDATSPLAPQFTYSTDGTTFTDTLTVGDLGAGAISPVFTMRLIKPADATLGLWAVRHNAVATSFA